MGDTRSPRTVLVTRFSALGDVAMTLPVVYGACAANPECRFVMLTRPAAARMFLNPPPNLTVEGVDPRHWNGITGLNRLLSEMISRHGIDTVVDLHDVLRTKIIRLLASLRGLETSSVDKGRGAKRALTRSRHKRLAALTPMGQRYRDAFHDAGLEVAGSFHSVFPSGRGDTAAFSAVTRPKEKGERWIAVAPFAAHAGKAWPLDSMEKVVAALAGRENTKIFIFGAGAEETGAIDRLAAGRPTVVNMARASIGLGAELALMSHCDVMLAMDSANMHLASLAGLRTVSVWGATHPYAGFYGTGQRPEDAVQADLPCRPCSVFGNKPCRRGDRACLKVISPETVLKRLDSIPVPTDSPLQKNRTE